MRVVRFTLSGKTAFFKKPEVNTYYYFTYGNIHKVALLGIFGAILGYGGYTDYQKMLNKSKKAEPLSESFPPFYEKLQNLRISIIPNYPKGYIPKKIQVFNNSVGYASKEQGGNLIVKEQWLENPSWDICFLVNSEEAEVLEPMLVQKKCVYIPYLGKNDHYADITNVRIFEGQEIAMEETVLDCLFRKHDISGYAIDDDDLEDDEELEPFKYEEKLPYALNPFTNNYETESFIFTNIPVVLNSNKVYEVAGQKLLFY